MNVFSHIKNLKWVLVTGGLAGFGGCSVGPDYHRPTPVTTATTPAQYSEAVAPDGTLWKTAQPAAQLPRGAWWESFGDSELNRLENLAAKGNQQLAAALANFSQARALVGTARADFLPQITAAPGMTRQRTSGNQFSRSGTASSSVTYNTFSVPLEASWELDLWGRVRRSVEGAQARMAAAADELESARLSLQAEVAINYFNLCAVEAQRDLFQQTIEAYKRSLQLTVNRHQSGIATELDVSQAETQLRSAEAQLPAIELQRAQLQHALATLCGQPAWGFAVTPSKNALENIPVVPPTLPAELLEHRPDIAAAEQRMISANAEVGIAKAAFFPKITLGGLAGFQSFDTSTLFNWESRLWSVGPSVQLPIFAGGRNRAQLAASRAAWEAAVADYRQVVLNGFQEVEDQLAAQRYLAQEHEAEAAALKAARRTLEISLNRYKGGVITYLEVSIAQSAALSHEQTVVKLAAERQAVRISLIKALGVGWENKKP